MEINITRILLINKQVRYSFHKFMKNNFMIM